MSLRRSLLALAALPILAIAGCDWGSTDPVSLSLSFEAAHTLNPDGSCRVQFVASASGFGTAQWSRVVVRESGAVVADYAGADVAQFWGASDISAGERQLSAPFEAPDAAADVEIEVVYRITGPERIVPLRPNCSAA